MRPRTDHRHVSDKYIEELRQLINIGFAEYSAQAGNAVVITTYLFGIGFVIYAKAPEFYTAKGLIIFSRSQLYEEYGPA